MSIDDIDQQIKEGKKFPFIWGQFIQKGDKIVFEELEGSEQIKESVKRGRLELGKNYAVVCHKQEFWCPKEILDSMKK